MSLPMNPTIEQVFKTETLYIFWSLEDKKQKNENSDTGSRTPVWTVRASCANRYTISDDIERYFGG